MALTAEDLLQPKGPLDSKLFPGLESRDLATRLNQYLSNGYNDERVAAQTDLARKDQLARAYALYQAFGAVVIRLSAEPVSVSVTEKGGHAYSGDQIKNFKELAAKYYNDFLGLLVIEGSVPPTQLPGSVSVKNTVEW